MFPVRILVALAALASTPVLAESNGQVLFTGSVPTGCSFGASQTGEIALDGTLTAWRPKKRSTIEVIQNVGVGATLYVRVPGPNSWTARPREVPQTNFGLDGGIVRGPNEGVPLYPYLGEHFRADFQKPGTDVIEIGLHAEGTSHFPDGFYSQVLEVTCVTP